MAILAVFFPRGDKEKMLMTLEMAYSQAQEMLSEVMTLTEEYIKG